MKCALYAVFDRATNTFSSPIMSQNEQMMKRSLRDLHLSEAAKHPLEQHQYVRYPDSFDVYFVGEYETDTGAVAGAAPVRIFGMSEFVQVP